MLLPVADALILSKRMPAELDMVMLQPMYGYSRTSNPAFKRLATQAAVFYSEDPELTFAQVCQMPGSCPTGLVVTLPAACEQAPVPACSNPSMHLHAALALQCWRPIRPQ